MRAPAWLLNLDDDVACGYAALLRICRMSRSAEQVRKRARVRLLDAKSEQSAAGETIIRQSPTLGTTRRRVNDYLFLYADNER
jgi:hypothetical protein